MRQLTPARFRLKIVSAIQDNWRQLQAYAD